jgi:hypothetical protein
MTPDYFDKLVLRTRGRVPLVVSKLETQLAQGRSNTSCAPELATSQPRVSDPDAKAPEPPLPPPRAPSSVTEPELEIAIGRLEIRASPSPRQLLASARARAGLTLSNYLDRRRG